MTHLQTYRQKRNFANTPEPSGDKAQAAGSRFVVQKHDASNLHFDFRLELDGVLLSWAVPKGPSLDPTVKRLAVQTEHHPIDYAEFEGRIPEGSYGSGTVMLWDRGTWLPEGDPRRTYRDGKLTFTLRGERMRGKWHLVRLRRSGKQQQWLLFKHDDEQASEDGDALVREGTRSIKTQRTLEGIGANESSSAKSSSAKSSSAKSSSAKSSNTKSSNAKSSNAKSSNAKSSNAKSSNATRAHHVSARSTDQTSKRRTRVTAPPEAFELELATLVEAPPEGDAWVHEIKWDGYRIAARLADEQVTLMTRNANDWTARAPEIAAAVAALPARNAILDGEAVALNEHGLSDFQLLQNVLSDAGQHALTYHVFDLLFLDGEDLRDLPLEQRKARLRQLLDGTNDKGPIRYSDHVAGSGKTFFQAATKAGLEGMISKRRDAPYRAGRARDWLKIKRLSRQEFVIGGYTTPGGSREHLGALHVGVWEGGKLRYSGKVGTGFSQASLRELAKHLSPLKRATPPFDDAPRERDTQWVEPKLVAEIAFTEVTRGGRLRHPSFMGLRADKPAMAVTHEEPEPIATAARVSSKLKLTHPDKLMFVDEGISKEGLALYYASIAELMLPHVVGRPLTLLRCPEGQHKQCFFQKHAGKGQPEALKRIPIRESEGKADYLYLEDSDGLLALVQMGVLEVHTWGARIDDVEHPDLLVIDLDPAPDVSWSKVAAAAHEVRQLLQQLGLESFVKTTGGKGLHVTVPLVPSLSFDQAKSFAQQLALALEAHDPEHYLATASKAKRQGRIFVDYLRNARGATFIAPYSTRAKPGATVAVPLRWEDVAAVDPTQFRVSKVATWRDRAAIAWPSFDSVKQKLTTGQTKALAAVVQARDQGKRGHYAEKIASDRHRE